ncbi:PREDICTED: zinc finger and BTB domain-containing protein 5-like [Branchiostoma belcheri]|uniref:Zinc finger and BTB domain-containing protein 5-like n=1 Tax=Branchiostoma belcheri TaxID=7741 RepID=A0A6P4Y634_BRABE|nr:PREDICTED: zinc finger and BTB domain-containing protein 5-like [Branchiostoma belcheri]
MAGNLDGSRSRGSWVHQPPRYFREVFSILKQQRLEQQYCDAQVIVNGQPFPAHKALLAANSNFFHQYFTINKDSSRVELNNISAESFKSIVEFMYSGRLLLQESNVTDVLQTASLLQMHDIVTVCCNFVKEKLQANRVEQNIPDNTQLQRTDSHVSFDPPQVAQQINQPGRPAHLGIAVNEEAGPSSLVGAMRRKCTVVPRRAISPSMGPDYSVDRDSGMNTSSGIGGHDSHPEEDVQTDSMDVVIRVKSEDTSDDRVLVEAGAASSSSQENNPALLSQSSDGSERDFVAPTNQQGAANPLQVCTTTLATDSYNNSMLQLTASYNVSDM